MANEANDRGRGYLFFLNRRDDCGENRAREDRYQSPYEPSALVESFSTFRGAQRLARKFQNVTGVGREFVALPTFQGHRFLGEVPRYQTEALEEACGRASDHSSRLTGSRSRQHAEPRQVLADEGRVGSGSGDRVGRAVTFLVCRTCHRLRGWTRTQSSARKPSFLKTEEKRPSESESFAGIVDADPLR